MTGGEQAEQRRGTRSLAIFGLPVHVRPGFFVFLVLAAVLNGGTFGLWLGASIALLTITHELGHALTARRYGARAEISLDMLAGYTSYEVTVQMPRQHRAMIAAAGPLAEIVPGLLILLALGANPLSIDAIRESEVRRAIWFAGPVLGLFNLLPVLPLDGGNIAALALDALVPGRGRRLWLRISLVVTALAFVGVLVLPDYRPLAVFIAMLLVLQFQTWRNDRRVDRLRDRHRADESRYMQLLAMLAQGNAYGTAQAGARVFEETFDPRAALLVARAAARLGELDSSLAWLHTANSSGADPEEILRLLDASAEMRAVSTHPPAEQLRASLRVPPA